MSFHQSHSIADRPPSKRRDIAEVLFSTAAEARHLSVQAEELDKTVASALAKSGLVAASDLQKTDLLRQGLEGLSQFLTALVDTLDGECDCVPSQAAARLLMQDQARRLQNIPSASDASDAADQVDIW